MKNPYLVLGLIAFGVVGCADPHSQTTATTPTKFVSDQPSYSYVGMD